MDILEFIKVYNRLCSSHTDCSDCPLEHQPGCQDILSIDVEFVKIVENWSKEHPVKTRQSEFLKMFPNAPIMSNHSIVNVAPCNLDENINNDCHNSNHVCSCLECKKKYWLQEIDDE